MNKTLTRAGLAEALKERMQISRQASVDFCNTTLDIVIEELSTGGNVKLPKFGNLDLIDKEERPGRNPRNGKPAVVSGRRVVTFRPCQLFRKLIEKTVRAV